MLLMEYCKRQTHGRGKESVFQYFHGIKSCMIAFCCLLIFHVFTCLGHAQAHQPELFLAPALGDIHILSNNEGIEKRQLCVERDETRVVIEEEVCCFMTSAGDSPPVVIEIPGHVVVATTEDHRSIRDHYTIFTDGTKLVRTTCFGDITLVDFAKDEWTVPMIGSPGMPKEGKCRVVASEMMLYRGADRLIVVVACTAPMHDKSVFNTSWTLASGLGIITMDDFKLISVETASTLHQGRD